MLIKPRPPTGLPSFGATYHTIRGPISVDWKWLVATTADPNTPTADPNVRNFSMNVTIPPNVVAEIHIPTMPGTLIEGEGTSANVFATQGGTTTITRGSGTHRLRAMGGSSTFEMN